MPATAAAGCPLCTDAGGQLVWAGERLRLIRAVDTPAHPAFYRVVWNSHVAEFGDLADDAAAECMRAVRLVEAGLRSLGADKINIASLGNMVPHLHWHVIARWTWDPHWPQPIWAGAPLRDTPEDMAERLSTALPALDQQLALILARSFPPA